MDNDKKLLYVLYAGGTFGKFLRFIVDKFSQKTPSIEGDPFTDIGTSHSHKITYSGLIDLPLEEYNQTFLEDNKDKKDMPVCIIVPKTEKHFLFLKKARWFRPMDRKHSPDDLWKKAIGEMPDMLKDSVNNIIKLYDLKEDAHYSWIPKFIVRDWYKLDFLQNLEDTYNYKWFKQFFGHEYFKNQKVFELDLETFFDWNTFIKNITELDRVFDLSLDFSKKDEMKELFDKGYSLDEIRQECNLAIDVLENRSECKLDNLDVATEGFIYAHIEKTNKGIRTPLVNQFLRDADEIKQFVEHYPSWYRVINPNMPKKPPKSEKIKDGDGE